MLSIVWQFVVAGAQMVTLVKKLFVEGDVVPFAVVSAATFGPAPELNTVSCTDAVELGLAFEVAVSVTGVLLVTLPGELYVTEVAVMPVSEPTPEERLHVTPWLVVSPVRVAVTLNGCPWLIVCGPFGDKPTVREGSTPIWIGAVTLA